MNSFEVNKIMGAVLGTCLFIMGGSLVAEAIYAPAEDKGPGYALPEAVAVADAGAAAGAATDAAPKVSQVAALLATANPEKGAATAKKCMACHNFGEGEPNKAGPHLFDIVGRAEGAVPDFAYSDAMKTHYANADVWTYDNLDHFLEKPSDYAPGTKMAFGGIKSPADRADLLAYLQTLSHEPVPFPAADAAAAPAAEAAAAPAAEAAPGAATPAAAPAAAAPAAEAPAAAAASGGTSPALLALLTGADAQKGANVAKKCMACHTFGEGEANKSGPFLYDIVGRAEGSVADFNYSDALKAHQANGDVWTYDNLDAFLAKPSDYAPGTKMAFGGIKSETDRANLLAYLQTLSANPVPFEGQ